MSGSRRFTYFAVALALLTVASLLPAREAFAARTHATFCAYYTDDTYTTQVGDCIFACAGTSCVGTKTFYKQCWQGQSCYAPDPICSDAPWCDPNWETCCCEIYGGAC